MRDKAFLVVAGCAILGLCLSSGTAVYLAVLATRPADARVVSPERSEAEKRLETELALKGIEGKANADEEMRLRVLRERKFLRELWEIDQKEKSGR